MSKIYKIYKITNLTNEKVYIGQTEREYIWAGDAPYGEKSNCRYRTKIENRHSSKDFINDIKENLEKLGNRNIKVEILEDNILTEELTNYREIYWIAKYNARNEKYGYNSQRGGNDRTPNEKTRKKQSDTRIKNGSSKGKNNPIYGRSGKDNPYAKKVICITTGEIFSTITEATYKYNIPQSNISRCCNRKRKSAGKINGEKVIWVYLEDYNNEYKGILRAGI